MEASLGMSLEIAVLGLGNLMRTDDALGMLTLEKLKARGDCPPGVRMIEGGTLGLDLIDSLWGVSHLIALDAVDAGADPGTLLRFSGPHLSDLPVSKSVHLLGFSDLMSVLRLMEASPSEVVLLGVQPQFTGWGTELTPEIQIAQASLIEAVFNQIAEWTEAHREAFQLSQQV
jgi:hydrogenase maturation protease